MVGPSHEQDYNSNSETQSDVFCQARVLIHAIGTLLRSSIGSGVVLGRPLPRAIVNETLPRQDTPPVALLANARG